MFKIVLLFILTIKCCDSARILGAVFTPSFSHQSTFWPIWKQLSLRGHQMVVLTTNPINDSSLTNLTEIDLSSSYEIMKSRNMARLFAALTHNITSNKRLLYIKGLNEIADHQLSHPQVQNLIKNNSEHFDLLMVEVTFPTQMAFAARFKVPFIGLMSFDAPSRIHKVLGNPINPVVYPDAVVKFQKNLNFYQRVISTFMLCLLLWWGDNYFYPMEDLTVKKHFGDDMPSLIEIEKNISMLFMNTNPIFNNIRPIGPNTISIGGGLHFQKSTLLSEDIKKYLDESKNGFIYFSLGSYIKSSELEVTEKKLILETLSELPYNVLLKFESDDNDIANASKNIKILNWIPQQEVLEHPNIKLFITQCGLQSMEEGIANGVLMIGLPFANEQFRNSMVLKSYQIGLVLDVFTLTKNEFKKAILKVIDNPKYRKNMNEVSEIYKDAEISGIKKAVWWTEYVLRHKGAKHLRNPGVELPFYQYFLLDVALFLLVIVFVAIYLLMKLLQTIIRLIKQIFFKKNKK